MFSLMNTLAGIFTIILAVKQQNQTISNRRRVLLEITNQHSLSLFLSFSLPSHTHIYTD